MPRKRTLYNNYREASIAVQKLGITSAKQYVRLKLYKRDPKLPSAPYRKYEKEWISWEDFLGLESRKGPLSFEEFCDTVVKMNITTTQEYKERYEEHPRLPACPDITYLGKGWVSWPHLFAPHYYETYEQAQVAARAIGANGRSSYLKLRHRDARLPPSPEKIYAEQWQSWGEFTGIFATNCERFR